MGPEGEQGPYKMRQLLVSALLTLAFISNAHADAVLDEARAHIEAGKPELAWKLLAPLNSERAGDVEFDYLLGVAALDTGRRTEAVFALERVLAVDPDHSQARAEIARAYFELFELERAKAEFDTVMQDEKLPATARDTISKFLSAIEDVQSDSRTAVDGYVSLALGTDDNVNTGPKSSRVAVPIFGGAVFTLVDAAAPQESEYTLTRLRGNVKHRLSPKNELQAGIGVGLRDNFDDDAEAFDYDTIDANVGLRYYFEELSHFTISAQMQDFSLDGDDYRDAIGLLGQWRHRLDSSSEVSVYGKITEIEYDDQPLRDADRQVLGGGYSRFFPGKYNPTVYIGLYLGSEEMQESGVDHLGYDLSGIRLGVQATYSPQVILYSSLNIEQREYEDDDPLFLETRDDDGYALTLGLRYRFTRDFYMAGEIFYAENDSNIEINENDKTTFAITARYDF